MPTGAADQTTIGGVTQGVGVMPTGATEKSPRHFQVIAVTNRHLCEGDFLVQLKRLAEAGFDRIILREKDMPPAEYLHLAEQVLRAVEPYDTVCTLHNYSEVAVELHVNSIHLPVGTALEKAEQLKVFHEVGCSIHSLEQLAQAEQAARQLQGILQKNDPLQVQPPAAAESATGEKIPTRNVPKCYVTAGHIFPTDCKKGLPGRGLSFLQEICHHANVPVYAIGGISPDNLESILRAGADGACLMSYCMRASERELRALVEAARSCQ